MKHADSINNLITTRHGITNIEHSHGADAFRTRAAVAREGFTYDGHRKAEVVPADEGDFDRYSPISTL
jgi:hypothetical protein